ncbi:hypothetical protein CPSG_01909 [Coccidioides posadasii str. Silveira]|uniref:Uncharacterized protein n=1 Tax=Coccidioides posadasii (strain RMSCC 757 / Silveira) TaxID=443226 RepID=E9CWS6_COCPS|nr:hypothetical protein CPSG_01909 [Coccidioides posadasii str. Silveira]
MHNSGGNEGVVTLPALPVELTMPNSASPNLADIGDFASTLVFLSWRLKAAGAGICCLEDVRFPLKRDGGVSGLFLNC